MSRAQKNVALLPPEVNRALYVRNLPYKITADEMYELFGKYGAIRQIRVGDSKETQGTAFVVYADIFDAKVAVDTLSGFNVLGRYLIVLYYQPSKFAKKGLGAGAPNAAPASASSFAGEAAVEEEELENAKAYFEEQQHR